MSRPYLFGPVSSAAGGRVRCGAADCLTVGSAPGVDVILSPSATWSEVAAHFPAGWFPEFVAWYCPYEAVANWVWEAPVPIVALAADWNFLWHAYRHLLPWCDVVLTDTAGVDVCRRHGIAQAQAACLHGPTPDFLQYDWPARERDIDVLFVGNLHPAVQRERLPWLGRLARWGGPRVVIATGTMGDAYRQLLARAKIVFNRSVRGEVNQRSFEAACAGALLFQERDNRETPTYFAPGRECVAYGADDLETLLDFYLAHETERAALAAAARAKVQHYAYDRLWRQALEAVVDDWDGLRARAGVRPRPTAEERLRARTAAALTTGGASDPTLFADLTAAGQRQPQEAAWQYALGLVTRRRDALERAVALAPTHALARLCLAETLATGGQPERATAEARQLLTLLESAVPLAPGSLDVGGGAAAFDFFRVEWERAAWEHAGAPASEEQAKRALLRWRLHSLLAAWTGGLAHSYEAVLARPDLTPSRLALGEALVRAGQPTIAVPHLANALEANPFDREAARMLDQALGAAGDTLGRRRLARARRQLQAAAPAVVTAEDWFQNAPPVGDELVSLLVLCCNEVEYTRQCLESVRQHTRPPYELVLVDNGSTDATPAFLEEVRAWDGPTRIEVIRNADNRGFPAGCNQALAQARGDYLVFLNNDTIVTPGWLDELLACLIGGWPRVGMVGATSNYTRPPQQVPVTYTDLKGLPDFAARHRQQFTGQALDTNRLTGFCLLARRDVLTQVGGFDEGYGLGFFDDDDLSVKVLQAGYRLAVARGVFIHHFGSRTFTGLGIDTTAQLRANFAKFQERWGAEHAAGYRLPGDSTPVQATLPSRRPRVSLTMIVKNEEENLADCLGPVRDLVDEIIVVDTGSTDRTKEIALGLGAKVFDFPWVDSFAAARNEALRHATGDWAFWLDGDDRVDATNVTRLRTLFASLGRDVRAYVMKCSCVPDAPGASATVVDHVRLFPLRPEIRWKYRVHEQILPAVRAAGGATEWTDVVVQHVGYTDPALRSRKLARDLRLLRLEQQEQPHDPFTLFNLASVLLELGQAAEALPAVRGSLERSHPQDSIVRKLYALETQALRQLGRPADALTACVAGRVVYPEDAELLFREGLLRRELGQPAEAEACFLRLLGTREGAHFASIDSGLTGFKTRHNLAVLYREQQRAAEAEPLWRAVVAEQPAFVPAWLGLGDLALQRRDWAAVETTALALEKAQAAGEALGLRVRGQLQRGEFAAARAVLEAWSAREPTALVPRRLLSHTLLQEGRDPAATEAALRALLSLAPDDAEARNNLALLLQQPRVAEPPARRGLASLIILCCNGLEYTRQCLAAVLAHTSPPYELVLVDNGSTDGTPAYLQEVAQQQGADRVLLLRNPTNRGFAPACNQGLSRARGDYLVLLNNDVVVTEGWLDGLLGWAMHGGATPAGLAGPVTNRTDLSQVVPANYAYPAGLAAFAANRRDEFAGLALARLKLAGFCLLALRQVVAHIGPLDERYETGNLEDFDWCVRARKAGYQPLLALDVFVHHFGSRTFAALEVDPGRFQSENLARFRAKWAGDPAAAELMAEPPPVEMDGPRWRTAYPRRAAVALSSFEEGVRRLHGGDPVGAEVSFLRVLTGTGEGVVPASVHHNLGAVYLRQGRTAEAEAQFRRAVQERPGFVASLRELGRLALRRRRHAEAGEWASALEQAGAAAPAAELRSQAAELGRAGRS